MIPRPPDFRRRQAILDHVRQTLGFYHPRAIDPSGGFHHHFKDDGSVYDRSQPPPGQQHPVRVRVCDGRTPLCRPSTRGIPGGTTPLAHGMRSSVVGALAMQPPGVTSGPWDFHHGRATPGWTARSTPMDWHSCCWQLRPLAAMAGVGCGAEQTLHAHLGTAGATLWEPQAWPVCRRSHCVLAGLRPYRGQNVNMHMCEAIASRHLRQPG